MPLLQYHRTATADVPAESLRWHLNSVRAPDSSLVNQWKDKLSRADRIIFEQCAGDALATFDYPLGGCRGTFASRLKNVYYATVQRW